MVRLPRGLAPDKIVHVYWNLHKLLWSVRQGGKVLAHLPEVHLSDVSWRVQPAGRERARREGCKNVHAYAAGRWRSTTDAGPFDRVRYNPYRDTGFKSGSAPLLRSQSASFYLRVASDGHATPCATASRV